jgi:hypothetical protein
MDRKTNEKKNMFITQQSSVLAFDHAIDPSSDDIELL